MTEERMNEIVMEETIPRRKRRKDRSREERDFRTRVRADVRSMKAAGIEIEIPTIQPDPTAQ